VPLVGTPVADRDVLELARLTRAGGFEDLAEKLETAYDRETRVLALDIAEREMLIRSLDDPPEPLAERGRDDEHRPDAGDGDTDESERRHEAQPDHSPVPAARIGLDRKLRRHFAHDSLNEVARVPRRNLPMYFAMRTRSA
jgi:hypothetical protein